MTRAFIAVIGLVAACSGEVGGDTPDDAGPGTRDALALDASATVVDAHALDAAESDAGPSMEPDATAPDASRADAAAPDAAMGPARPLLLAVGYGRRRMISRDGTTWTHDVVVDPNGGDDDNLLRGAAYGDGRFLAVGGAARGRTIASIDGVSWIDEVTQLRAFVSGAVFGAGQWVIAGGNGLRMASADHGRTWDHDAGYFAGHFRGVAFGRGIFVAAGHTHGPNSIGLVSHSADARTWVTLPQPGLSSLSAIAFGADVFVAVGRSRVTRSSDGASWTEITLPGMARDITGVAFVEGEFLVPSEDGLWRSPDGVTWTRIDGFTPNNIAFVSGTYVGSTYASQRWTSPDRTTWTRVSRDDGPAFTAIVAGEAH